MTNSIEEKLDDVLARLTLVEDLLRNIRKPAYKNNDLMTVAEASKEYRISRSTIYKHPEVCTKILGKTLVSRSKLEAVSN